MIPHPELNSSVLLLRAIAAADPACRAEHERHRYQRHQQMRLGTGPCPLCEFLDLCLEHPSAIAAIIVGELVATCVPIPSREDFG
jgi:3-methyladenine DNA glycosylase Mpg